ncbi:MAG: hypothetical protein HC905_19900 [Bacteroidales bacterium]|nr:hypothetical protein [Bacteroidales bacterium]
MKSKMLNNYFLLALLVMGGIFISCDKDDDDNTPKTNTISDIVVSDNRFSILEKALIKTGLTTTLATSSRCFHSFLLLLMMRLQLS